MSYKEKRETSKNSGLGRLQLTIIDPAANLKEIDADQNQETFYLSCLTGGTTAANIAVDQCQAVREVWDEGSDHKAKSLAKMFSLVMLSQWFYQLRGQDSLSKKYDDAYKSSAWMLLSLFEKNPKEPLFPILMDSEIEIAMKLDSQFRYEIEKEDDMASYAILLLSWAVQAAGDVVLDWNKVKVPLNDFADLSSAQAIINDKPFKIAQNLVDILAAQQRGVISMASFYSQMNPSKKEDIKNIETSDLKKVPRRRKKTENE